MLTPIYHTLPALWASYLINGDDSGLDAGDKAHAYKFIADNNLPKPCSCSDEPWVSWQNDSANRLGGDVLEYTFLIASQDNHAVIS